MKTRLCVRLAAVLLSAAVVPVAFAQGEKAAANDKPSRVVHELKLSSPYQDLPGLSLGLMDLLGGGGGKAKSFYQLVADLKAFAEKHGGAEMLVDLSSGGFAVNDAQIAELERAFKVLRDAKVRTTAYLENASTRHYLVACLCDKIVLADAGILDFAAPAMSVMFFKDALDLLGVQFQATRMGEFKGAVEPFVLSEMSSHLRNHYLEMVTSMNTRNVQVISDRRRLTPEKVRELQGQRLITAKAAREAGLVDDLAPWQGARQCLGGETACTFESVGKKKEKKSGFNFMSLLTGFGSGKSDEKKLDEESVAVLHLSGVIVDGEKESPGQIVSGPTVALVRKLASNELVRGLVVRVNSPGGSGTASEAILLALRAFAEKKPVVVSMGSMAASGGYYVSMVGGPVFAEHNTLTGSIGVFGMRPNVAALARRVGVRNELVALDDSAGLEDPFRPLQDAQLKQIENFIRDFYDRFRRRILESRKNLTDEQLLAVAGGRVWSGQQAIGLGLVDKLGGLDDAVAAVREKLGDKDIPVATYPESDANPLKMLESLFEGVSIDGGKLELLKAAGLDLSQSLAITLDALRNPGTPRAWMLLPCELSIR
jgi:protease-4